MPVPGRESLQVRPNTIGRANDGDDPIEPPRRQEGTLLPRGGDRQPPARRRSLEQLGFYNPVARGNSVEMRLDLARIDYWLSVGAQPSDRVAQLVKDYRKSQPTAVAA